MKEAETDGNMRCHSESTNLCPYTTQHVSENKEQDQ